MMAVRASSPQPHMGHETFFGISKGNYGSEDMKAPASALRSYGAGSFINGGDLRAQLYALQQGHARLHACLDESRVQSWERDLATQSSRVDDFGPDANGGRGDHYLNAQSSNVLARAYGMSQLLQLLQSGNDQTTRIILDLLGGDGLLRRVAEHLGIHGMDILTCDISQHMVESSWANGMPAILQRADKILCRTSSVDGVLLAYGTHHIAPCDRLSTVEEGYRVLRPGGVFVLHDFEVNSPMDDWFAQVVDPLSVTRHKFQHFTRAELAGYLTKAGFSNCRIVDMADPYRSTGESAAAAERAMGQYLVNMYGLVKLELSVGGDDAARWAIKKASEIFGRTNPIKAPMFDHAAGTWRFEVPRTAMVGTGVRPAADRTS